MHEENNTVQIPNHLKALVGTLGASKLAGVATANYLQTKKILEGQNIERTPSFFYTLVSPVIFDAVVSRHCAPEEVALVNQILNMATNGVLVLDEKIEAAQEAGSGVNVGHAVNSSIEAIGIRELVSEPAIANLQVALNQTGQAMLQEPGHVALFESGNFNSFREYEDIETITGGLQTLFSVLDGAFGETTNPETVFKLGKAFRTLSELATWGKDVKLCDGNETKSPLGNLVLARAYMEASGAGSQVGIEADLDSSIAHYTETYSNLMLGVTQGIEINGATKSTLIMKSFMEHFSFIILGMNGREAEISEEVKPFYQAIHGLLENLNSYGKQNIAQLSAYVEAKQQVMPLKASNSGL